MCSVGVSNSYIVVLVFSTLSEPITSNYVEMSACNCLNSNQQGQLKMKEHESQFLYDQPSIYQMFLNIHDMLEPLHTLNKTKSQMDTIASNNGYRWNNGFMTYSHTQIMEMLSHRIT